MGMKLQKLLYKKVSLNPLHMMTTNSYNASPYASSDVSVPVVKSNVDGDKLPCFIVPMSTIDGVRDLSRN